MRPTAAQQVSNGAAGRGALRVEEWKPRKTQAAGGGLPTESVLHFSERELQDVLGLFDGHPAGLVGVGGAGGPGVPYPGTHGDGWGAGGEGPQGVQYPAPHHPGYRGHDLAHGGGGLHTPPGAYLSGYHSAGPHAPDGKGGDVLEGKLLAAVHQQRQGGGAPGRGNLLKGVVVPPQSIPHQLLPYGGAPPPTAEDVGSGRKGGAGKGSKARGARGRGGAAGRAGNGKDAAKVGAPGGKGGKGPGPDGKPFVSHSVAEKQRRDRINTLIDELREIVPPQARGGDGADGGSSPGTDQLKENTKRPKHEVLADTISLMRRLLINPDTMHLIKLSGKGGDGMLVTEWDGSNEEGAGLEPETTCRDGIEEVADLEGGEVLISVRGSSTPNGSSGGEGREGSANSGGTGSGRGGGSGAGGAEGGGVRSAPRGPGSGDDASFGSGQPKCQTSNKLTVTVKCADRYGLLHTLTSSLKSMGLRTQTAVISTSGDGIVKDTFTVDRASCGLESDEIKATLMQDIIQGSSLTNIEPKRKRSSMDKGG